MSRPPSPLMTPFSGTPAWRSDSSPWSAGSATKRVTCRPRLPARAATIFTLWLPMSIATLLPAIRFGSSVTQVAQVLLHVVLHQFGQVRLLRLLEAGRHLQQPLLLVRGALAVDLLQPVGGPL